MNNKKEQGSMEQLSTYIENNYLKIAIVVFAVLVLFFGAIVFMSFSRGQNKKALNAIDEISFNLTNGADKLDEAELETRRSAAFQGLQKYLSKGGVAGVRANMLAAEIVYSKGDYSSAAKYWIAASKKSKKSYTSSLSLFNAGSSYEELDDLKNALSCYKEAASDPDFLLSTHALFNLGRVQEAMGDASSALETYKSLQDKMGDTSWGDLAKTRIIKLELNKE